MLKENVCDLCEGYEVRCVQEGCEVCGGMCEDMWVCEGVMCGAYRRDVCEGGV